MDPLTHALSGAVAGRAFIPGPDTTRGRVARAALFVGALFPDIDVVLNPFEPNGLGTIRYHRGVTHSLLVLPFAAVILAAILERYCRRRDYECPPWWKLSLLFGAGLALHIAFDLITSFGTMVWSPLNWSRVAWDTTFILDPYLTGILMLPFLLAWIYSQPQKQAQRALSVWAVMTAMAAGIVALELAVLLPAAFWGAAVVSAVLGALFFLPGLPAGGAGWGFRVSRRGWCRAFACATLLYLGLSAAAHQAAVKRVENFVHAQGLAAENVAAIPMPPSFLYWAGLVSTRDAVYYGFFDVLSSEPARFVTYEQARENAAIDAAMKLPQVQVILRFTRFPVVLYAEKDGVRSVELTDLRFAGPRTRRPLPFTYRVRFDSAGEVIEEGWARPTTGVESWISPTPSSNPLPNPRGR